MEKSSPLLRVSAQANCNWDVMVVADTTRMLLLEKRLRFNPAPPGMPLRGSHQSQRRRSDFRRRLVPY
jgi:hypothetical protein